MSDRIELFRASDGVFSLPVRFSDRSAWLTQADMALLFGRDQSIISRHIKSAEADGEIDPKTMYAKNAYLGENAARKYEVASYNLEVVIAVGYRVHSKRGVEFRRWATKILMEYIEKGYAVNRKRLTQLGQAVEVMKRISNSLNVDQILEVVNSYSTALDLLDDYDHQTIAKPDTKTPSSELTYEDCREFINRMKFSASSSLFGNEKDGSFKSALGAVYQSFGGQDLYPSAQEKAANLLYLVTKNHGFSDGNKRIAAGLFLYFLSRNKLLARKDGSKRISDHTLVALTVMIAESRPEEKEMMVNLVMNFLA